MKNPICDLRSRRKELGYTLETVGRAVGVSKATVSKWENGNIKNMKRDKIALLAKTLMINPTDILGFDETADSTRSMEEGEFFIHPEDLAAIKRSSLSDGTKDRKFTIVYQKDGEVIFDKFLKDDYDFILRTIDMLKSKSAL